MNKKIFKVGDKVRVKSLDWYNKNKNKDGNVEIGPTFVIGMSYFCGKVFTIESITPLANYILLNEDRGYSWHKDFFENPNSQLEFDFMEEKK
jgi:hypothetical protein